MAKRLGKGLGALIQDNENQGNTGIQEVEIGQIFANPNQPRKIFNQEKLEELAASIREHGIIQPITVHATDEGYEIIAGERRWRAAAMAGLETIPIHVRPASSSDKLELALIENLQRDDLSAMEEAYAYKELIEDLSYTQDQLAKRIGKSRPHIANTLRLLALPQEIQDALDLKMISAGHARALLMCSDTTQLIEIYKAIVEQGLSVREAEARCANSAKKPKKEAGKTKAASVFEKDVILRIQDHLGTGVKISHTEKKGVIEVEFYSEEDLIRICDLMLGGE